MSIATTVPDYRVPGAKLQNGATVITTKVHPNGDIYVLAMKHDDYVTWWLDPREGDCYTGHYFNHKYERDAFERAVEDLTYRTTRH